VSEKSLIVILLSLIAGSVIISISEGIPNQLPGITLGSVAILFVLRTLVLFASAVSVVVVFSKALDGHLPIEIGTSGLRYADETGSTRHTEQGFGRIDKDQKRQDGNINELTKSMCNLEQRIDKLELHSDVAEMEF